MKSSKRNRTNSLLRLCGIMQRRLDIMRLIRQDCKRVMSEPIGGNPQIGTLAEDGSVIWEPYHS
jgi:methylglyoxal synthase